MPQARSQEFRLYYNHTIQPELLRLERVRVRLLVNFLFTGLAFLTILVLHARLQILLVTLSLNIPLGLMIVYQLFKARQFIRQFKPRIIGLLLDFIDDGPNFDPLHPLSFDAYGRMPKQSLMESGLFDLSDAHLHAEDNIKGKVGEMAFSLAELHISAQSALRNQLKIIFHGVFIHARFNEPTEGQIIAWPRNRLQFHTRAVRAFTFNGAIPVDDEIHCPAFEARFAVFATPDTFVTGILTLPMQEAIAAYLRHHQGDLSIAVHQREVYVAISREKDMLEPSLWRANLSFDQINAYYADIHDLLELVAMLDQTH
jgi:hypothetical protein